MKRFLSKNTPLTLPVFLILAKIVGAFYKIPLTSIIGAEGMGLYSAVFPLYCLALSLSSGGLTSAVSVVVARRKEGFGKKALSVLMLLVFILSVIFSALIIFLASVVIKPLSAYRSFILLLVTLPAVVFASQSALIRGYFQGKQVFFPGSVSHLVEQVIKAAAGLSLCLFFAKNPFLGALYALAALSVSEAFTYAYLSFRLKRENIQRGERLANEVIRLLIPMTLSELITPLTVAAESVIAVRILTFISPSSGAAEYGVLSGAASSVLALPHTLFCAVSAWFLPVISSKPEEERSKATSTLLNASLGVGMLCSVGLTLFSDVITELLFGALTPSQKSLTSALLLAGAIIPVLGAVRHSLVTLLIGVGKSRLGLIIGAIGGAIRVILCLVLPYKFGVIGVMLAQVIGLFISVIVAIVFAAISVKPRLNLTPTLKAATGTLVFALTSVALRLFIPQNTLPLSLIPPVIGVVSCLITAVITGLIRVPILKRRATGQ